MRIDQPTIRQMIERLQELPQDVPFVIEDPDTGWIIETFDLEEDDGAVVVTASYADMNIYRNTYLDRINGRPTKPCVTLNEVMQHAASLEKEG